MKDSIVKLTVKTDISKFFRLNIDDIKHIRRSNGIFKTCIP